MAYLCTGATNPKTVTYFDEFKQSIYPRKTLKVIILTPYTYKKGFICYFLLLFKNHNCAR